MKISASRSTLIQVLSVVSKAIGRQSPPQRVLEQTKAASTIHAERPSEEVVVQGGFFYNVLNGGVLGSGAGGSPGHGITPNSAVRCRILRPIERMIMRANIGIS